MTKVQVISALFPFFFFVAYRDSQSFNVKNRGDDCSERIMNKKHFSGYTDIGLKTQPSRNFVFWLVMNEQPIEKENQNNFNALYGAVLFGMCKFMHVMKNSLLQWF